MHRWVHVDTRNPVYWGPRSWHKLSSLESGCAVVGPGRVGTARCGGGGEGSAEANKLGQRKGPNLYGLLCNMKSGPRLGGEPREFPSDRRAVRGIGCRGLWGRGSFYLGGCGVRLADPYPPLALAT